MSEIRVAVVAFDQISPFHLSVPCVVFGENQLQAPAYRLQVCAAEPGALSTSADFGLTLAAGLEVLQQAEVVIVPSWRDHEETAPAPLLAALRAAYQRGARIVGLCLGAYVLAQAGLLDGRRATTHWAYADDFARRFPQVEVDAAVLYLDDGPLLTSAGTAAGLDCCLHLLRQLSGAEAANSVARQLVTPPHRQGGQAQYIEQPLPASVRDERLSGLLDWVRGHLHQAHSLDSLAERALMSRRTFTRHFRQLTGGTVQGWLLAERLALTQRLLETSALPVEHIAQQAGFGSPASLRLHFRKAFGVAPSEWRQTFQGARD